MPKTKINFSNTVIYKICCNDSTITNTYVGHTTDIRKRKSQHKGNTNNEKSKKYNFNVYKNIRENGGWDNWNLIQIEEYPCKDVNEAKARERYWIETLKCSLNMKIPNKSQKEYQEENKEIIAEYRKQYQIDKKEEINERRKKYREANKEVIYEKAKERIRCEACNCDVPRRHISTHNKNKSHLENISKLNVDR